MKLKIFPLEPMVGFLGACLICIPLYIITDQLADAGSSVQSLSTDSDGKIIAHQRDGTSAEIPNSESSNNKLSNLTLSAGDSDQTADANGDELVLENSSGPTGLSMLTEAGQGQNIYFGDEDDNNIGRILYDHGANSLGLYTNNAQALFMESDQDVQVPNGTLILSADVYTKIATTTSYTFNSVTDTGIDLSEDGTYLITVRRDSSGSSSIYLAASNGTTGTANLAGAKAFGDAAGTISFTGNNLEFDSGHAGTENFTIKALRLE